MILIINTSGKDLEFVLGDKYKSVVVEKQSVALPAQCEKFIAECGATWRDISAIGIVVGPGSFTGIRLGIAYAKGLGLGLNIPVVGPKGNSGIIKLAKQAAAKKVNLTA